MFVGDNFNRADAVDLGGDWSIQTSAYSNLQIVSNRVRGVATGTDNLERYDPVSFNPNQFGRFTLAVINAAVNTVTAGICLRASTDLNTFYFFEMLFNDALTSRIQKRNAGADTVLASEAATTWAANDVLEGQIVGSGLKLLRNGAVLLTATDTAIIGGKVGILIVLGGEAVTTIEVDSWQAGDYGLVDYNQFPKPQVNEAAVRGEM